jgi:hypothetical protein
VGNKTHEEPEETPYMLQYGKDAEPWAITAYLESHPGTYGVKPGMIRHRERDYIAATPDFIGWDEVTGGLFNLEVKCRRPGTPVPTVEGLPDKYIIQLQIQGLLTGIDDMRLWIWTPAEMVEYRLHPDKHLREYLLAECEMFKRCVEAKIRPPKFTKKKKGPIQALMQQSKAKFCQLYARVYPNLGELSNDDVMSDCE